MFLQLYIELEVNGLQIAERSSDGSQDQASLLKKIRQYRDAWLDLDLGPPVDQYCGEEMMSLWELRDGVFANAYSSNHADLEANGMEIFPLGIDGGHTRTDFRVAFNEFTLDLGQDLVALAGVDPQEHSHAWVRLCSATTGQVHPQAKHPLLSVELGFNVLIGIAFSLTLEIKNELIVVKFASTEGRVYEIVIWNWKTGRLLNRIGCDNGIGNFLFLDKNRLVVWSAHSASGSNALTGANLLVYEQIGSANSGHDVLDSGTFNISSFPKLSPAFTFQFPELQASSEINPMGFLLRSDYGSGSKLAQSAPFAYSRALTLGLTMSLTIDGDSFPLRIFVGTNQLLDCIERARAQLVSKLSWEDWGEHATRWFQADEPDHWICWMFGSRFIIGIEHISVVDFHTPTVRRHANRHQDTYVSLEKPEDDSTDREERIRMGQFPIHVDEEYIIIDSSGPDELRAMSENAVVVDIVTAQEPTILPYFDKPVTSLLPYRVATRYNFGFGLGSNEMTVYIVGGSGETADSP
ncbi:hypothetical protein FRC06_010173 [Ceratobasidium sp. 370]|nr:hypothetical protein FRC06_010173 [Ceratobasidium sp. 370]